jgi:hypothetical protein
VIPQRKETEAMDFKDGNMQTRGRSRFRIIMPTQSRRESLSLLPACASRYRRSFLLNDKALEAVIIFVVARFLPHIFMLTFSIPFLLLPVVIKENCRTHQYHVLAQSLTSYSARCCYYFGVDCYLVRISYSGGSFRPSSSVLVRTRKVRQRRIRIRPRTESARLCEALKDQTISNGTANRK